MTAIEIREPGGPDLLVPVERPQPTLGADDVLIKVAAAGVNGPDVLQRQGRYPPPLGASDTPGLEVELAHGETVLIHGGSSGIGTTAIQGKSS